MSDGQQARSEGGERVGVVGQGVGQLGGLRKRENVEEKEELLKLEEMV